MCQLDKINDYKKLNFALLIRILLWCPDTLYTWLNRTNQTWSKPSLVAAMIGICCLKTHRYKIPSCSQCVHTVGQTRTCSRINIMVIRWLDYYLKSSLRTCLQPTNIHLCSANKTKTEDSVCVSNNLRLNSSRHLQPKKKKKNTKFSVRRKQSSAVSTQK